MYILVLIIATNTNLSSLSQEFESEINCLQAINKIMDFEPNIKIRARCVKK